MQNAYYRSQQNHSILKGSKPKLNKQSLTACQCISLKLKIMGKIKLFWLQVASDRDELAALVSLWNTELYTGRIDFVELHLELHLESHAVKSKFKVRMKWIWPVYSGGSVCKHCDSGFYASSQGKHSSLAREVGQGDKLSGRGFSCYLPNILCAYWALCISRVSAGYIMVINIAVTNTIQRKPTELFHTGTVYASLNVKWFHRMEWGEN